VTAKVLDSWALLAFFKDEPSGAVVESLLKRADEEKARLLLCVVNWGEVYYAMWRAGGREAAESVAEDLARLPLELVEADLALTRVAAAFKATNKMAYADSFAAALAKTRKGELVTGDPEFRALEKEIKIRWLN